jgi:hypothetical protein
MLQNIEETLAAYRVEGSTLKVTRLNSFKVRLENVYAMYSGIFRTDLILTTMHGQNHFKFPLVVFCFSALASVSAFLCSNWLTFLLCDRIKIFSESPCNELVRCITESRK